MMEHGTIALLAAGEAILIQVSPCYAQLFDLRHFSDDKVTFTTVAFAIVWVLSVFRIKAGNVNILRQVRSHLIGTHL
jgi:hypothetical protein